MQRIQWELRLVGLLTAAGLAGGTAFAETVELVTYYPTSSNTGDLHVNSLTVGANYNGVTPPDGQVFIFDRLGIGTNAPAGSLHVVGPAGQADRVLFMPGAGTGTIRVGIGTANPQAPLQVGASNLFVQADQGGNLELGGNNATANPVANGLPYIDFHFGTGAAQDFNARIINSGNNQLAIQTASGGSVLTVNGANVGIGNAYAPGAAVPNGQPGNLDVNDIFLRGANRWASQGGGAASFYYYPALLPRVVGVTRQTSINQGTSWIQVDLRGYSNGVNGGRVPRAAILMTRVHHDTWGHSGSWGPQVGTEARFSPTTPGVATDSPDVRMVRAMDVSDDSIITATDCSEFLVPLENGRYFYYTWRSFGNRNYFATLQVNLEGFQYD